MHCGTNDARCWLLHYKVELARYLESIFIQGILLDHGTGLVIGEIAVIGDRVSQMQGVTLGELGILKLVKVQGLLPVPLFLRMLQISGHV
ncbi:putative serine O-acetyltransferase [Helianthus annuus]|nr:putative serine O-acetyltransferase [Helianthus annuus]